MQGSALSTDEVEDFKRGSVRRKAYNEAVRFISYRARSYREVLDRLKKSEYDSTVAEDVLSRLIRNGLLNDLNFGSSWVADRMNLKPRSRSVLASELYQKGLDSEAIKSTLAEVSSEDYRAMIVKLIAKKRRQTRFQDDAKLIAFLGRQGYSYEDIRGALTETDAAT
jgi:regulatory protein